MVVLLCRKERKSDGCCFCILFFALVKIIKGGSKSYVQLCHNHVKRFSILMWFTPNLYMEMLRSLTC